MQLSHTRPVVSATFDEPNLVSAAGLVPLMALARTAGLRELADERLSVQSDKGANAGLKLSESPRVRWRLHRTRGDSICEEPV